MIKLFCTQCEALFGPWDQHGIELLRRLDSGEGDALNDLATTIDVDYDKLKLFVLSMLWRADASKRPIYSRIDIGPKWREILIKAILESCPGDAEFFSIVVFRFREAFEQATMFDPHREKIDQLNLHTILHLWRIYDFYKSRPA